MKNDDVKVKKTTIAKKTTKTTLPPPPPPKTIKATKKTESKTVTKKIEPKTKAVTPQKVETEKIEIKKVETAVQSPKVKTAQVNLNDIKLVDDFNVKKELPLWVYWVFVPLIFCMLLFIVVFAIGAAAYSG